MTTNDEIANEYEFSGGYADHMEKGEFIKSLNKASIEAQGGKEPTCAKCGKQIQTNHCRVVELKRLGQIDKVYHGDCAMLFFSELNPQRDDKIKAATVKEIFAELDNLHIVENWSTQKGKGIPLLLKQIGAYRFVKKKYGID